LREQSRSTDKSNFFGAEEYLLKNNKNYVKEGQKLPLYGVGPYIICGMLGTTFLGIVIFCYMLEIGAMGMPWLYVFRFCGGVLMVIGAGIWFTGALRSGMDDNIADNKLKTDGIYAWVRNPMYSGLWIVIFGLSLMWHNVCLIPIVVINWLIMTISLMSTEEKWLLRLYGKEYEDYKKRVNRCIPWFPREK